MSVPLINLSKSWPLMATETSPDQRWRQRRVRRINRRIRHYGWWNLFNTRVCAFFGLCKSAPSLASDIIAQKIFVTEAQQRQMTNSERAWRAAQQAEQEDRLTDAMNTYTEIATKYPRSNEAARALYQLATHSEQPQALKYLSTLRRRFPSLGAQAMLQQSTLLAKTSPERAEAVRKEILRSYPTSDVAAELRWAEALEAAKHGDLRLALRRADEIAKHNKKGGFAAAAAYWKVMWTAKQEDPSPDAPLSNASKRGLQKLLDQYPRSYYAWRSAEKLGKPIGGPAKGLVPFDDPLPHPAPAPAPAPAAGAAGGEASAGPASPFAAEEGGEPVSLYEVDLPCGSWRVRRLYRKKRYAEAWEAWRKEFPPKRRTVISAAELATDAFLRYANKDYGGAVARLAGLEARQSGRVGRTERKLYAALEDHPGFWQAMYPIAWWPQLAQWARRRNVNPLLVLSVIRQESRFVTGLTSSAGAQGVMQVMPATGQQVASGLGLGSLDLATPEHSILVGTSYLSDMMHKYRGNPALALAGYNAGPGNVDHWVSQRAAAEKVASDAKTTVAFALQRSPLAFLFRRKAKKAEPAPTASPSTPPVDWDRFVEEIPFGETRYYTKAVLANYWCYLRLYNSLGVVRFDASGEIQEARRTPLRFGERAPKEGVPEKEEEKAEEKEEDAPAAPEAAGKAAAPAPEKPVPPAPAVKPTEPPPAPAKPSSGPAKPASAPAKPAATKPFSPPPKPATPAPKPAPKPAAKTAPRKPSPPPRKPSPAKARKASPKRAKPAAKPAKAAAAPAPSASE